MPAGDDGPQGQPDVMGYHTADEIPIYWKYARDVHAARPDVRADRLVDAARAPVPGLGVVGQLHRPRRPDELRVRPEVPRAAVRGQGEASGRPRTANRARTCGRRSRGCSTSTGVTLGLLRRARALHRARRARSSTASRPPRCRTRCRGSRPSTPPASSTTSGRTTSSERDALAGNLPSVSWVMPVEDKGEHPPDSIEAGQAYVAKIDQRGDAGARASSGCAPRSSSPGTTGAASTTT